MSELNLSGNRWAPKKPALPKETETNDLYAREMEKIETMLKELYGLKIDIKIKNFLLTGSFDDLKKSFPFMADKDPNQPAIYRVTIRMADGSSNQSSVVYLPERHRQRLAYSTDQSKLGKDLPFYIDAIEETGHFLYREYYFTKYQREACSAMVELVAVLDKYNLIERLNQKVYQEALDEEDRQLLFSLNTSANNVNALGKVDGEYVVGHRMGVFFIGLLNETYRQAFQRTHDIEQAAAEAGQLLAEFYQLDNRTQLIFLLNQGFPLETYSELEEQGVRRILAELDIDESQLTKV